MLSKKSKIFVAGHKGLVGSAIVRKLTNKGYKNLITIEKKNLDLTNQSNVEKFLKKKKNHLLYLLLLQKLVVFILTIDLKLNLFITIYLFKIILSIQLLNVE